MFLEVPYSIAMCNQKITQSLISALNICSAPLLLPGHQDLKQLQKTSHEDPWPTLFLQASCTEVSTSTVTLQSCGSPHAALLFLTRKGLFAFFFLTKQWNKILIPTASAVTPFFFLLNSAFLHCSFLYKVHSFSFRWHTFFLRVSLDQILQPCLWTTCLIIMGQVNVSITNFGTIFWDCVCGWNSRWRHRTWLSGTLFSSRTFLPSSSPMLLSIRDNIQRHTVISHRAASLPHLPQPALCTRGHQKIGEAVYSLLYSVAHRSLETQI